jgi:hypothetical protein
MLFSYIRWTFRILLSEFIRSLLLLLITDIVTDILLKSRESFVIISISFFSYYKNSNINGGRFFSICNAVMKDEIFRNLKLNSFLIICSEYSNTALFRFVYVKKESLNFVVEIHILSDSRLGISLKFKNMKEEDKTRFRVLWYNLLDAMDCSFRVFTTHIIIYRVRFEVFFAFISY